MVAALEVVKPGNSRHGNTCQHGEPGQIQPDKRSASFVADTGTGCPRNRCGQSSGPHAARYRPPEPVPARRPGRNRQGDAPGNGRHAASGQSPSDLARRPVLPGKCTLAVTVARPLPNIEGQPDGNSGSGYAGPYIVSRILPVWLAVSIILWASAAAASGRAVPVTGLSLPSPNRGQTVSRS